LVISVSPERIVASGALFLMTEDIHAAAQHFNHFSAMQHCAGHMASARAS
jgi:hypothetical protein